MSKKKTPPVDRAVATIERSTRTNADKVSVTNDNLPGDAVEP